MRRVTGIAAGAAIAATGLLTAGCLQGGPTAAGTAPSSTVSDDSSTPAGAAGSPADQQAVAAAYGKTLAAGSARIATTTAVGLGNLSAPLHADGTISFADSTVDLTESLPGSGSAPAETRFVNGVLYEHLPSSLAGQLSNGKPWISLQLASMNAQSDGSLKQLFTDTPTNPSIVLAFLHGVGTSVTNLGSATIGGSPTTHYQLTLNLDQAAQGQSQATQAGIKTLEQEVGSNQLPAQVWIDQAGRLRQISIKETLTGSPLGNNSGSTSTATTTPTTATTAPASGSAAPGTGGSAAVSVAFTATFSDFGVPTNISAPPTSQVTDLTGQLGGN